MQLRKNNGQYGRRLKGVVISGGVVMIIIFALSQDFIIDAIVKHFNLHEQLNYTSAEEVTKAVMVERGNYQKKIGELKDDVLVRLANCETNGIKEPDAAIVFDSNNEPSIGRYQFQRKTVQYYVKQFEGREIDRVEAIQIAINSDKATALAKKIMFEDGDGPNEWFNCSKKLGFIKEVELIKKISE